MDEYLIEYSVEALDDLRQIYSYIAFTLYQPDAAQKLVNDIREKILS